jgi:hypothetical protein
MGIISYTIFPRLKQAGFDIKNMGIVVMGDE